MGIDILTLYRKILKIDRPYPFQARLAEQPWPDLLDIPTGLGKTAAVLLAWICKRANHDAGTPRRLVWCLPMRVLAEQTFNLAQQWCLALQAEGICRHAPKVYMLMGGNIDQDWDARPEDDAILIGTQDQLLSRALNRGYAMSRFRWPLDFALLNNDCFWVFDEVQLMDSGLPTSTQLEAFRAMLGTVFPCRSLWISATLDASWLASADFASRMDSLETATLLEDDLASPQVRRRIEASKPVSGIDGQMKPKALAEAILDAHQQGTLTLVIRNSVKDALTTWTELKKALGRRNSQPELALLHSRFRPKDRQAHLGRTLAPLDSAGRIVVSTQVVEAGIDISAATLFTDIAPWPSLVQRFGRCNRHGEQPGAAIFWLDRKITSASALPYSEEELVAARTRLATLKNASPSSLPKTEGGMKDRQVIRKQDILDLFDTTPDLAGEDVDVSPYIRSAGDLNVHVFWRDCDAKSDCLPGQAQPTPEELCPAPVGEVNSWLEKRSAWIWDFDEGTWRKIQRAYPGARLLLCRHDGGYSAETGWDPGSRAPVEAVPAVRSAPESDARLDGDGASEADWQELAVHCGKTLSMLSKMLARLGSPALEALRKDLEDAAVNHDWGKLHAVFQEACAGADASRFWAKAPVMKPYARPGFRHELASALAMLAQGGHKDLAVWLAASHHGKIGLSIRSLPGEKQTQERTTRGIAEGDELPACGAWPRTTLRLACMELGLEDGDGPSWLDRMLGLLEEHGPFTLAYLSALIRIADWRASAGCAKEASDA